MNASVQDPSRRFAGFSYSASHHSLLDPDGRPVSLRPQSLEVFRVLAQRHDQVVAKQTLFEAVWPHTEVTDDSLVQCIADIRRALGESGHQVLRTVPRRGYRLIADAPVPALSGEGMAPDRVLDPQPRLSPTRAPVWLWATGAIAMLAVVAMMLPTTTPGPTSTATPTTTPASTLAAQQPGHTMALAANDASTVKTRVANAYAPLVAIDFPAEPLAGLRIDEPDVMAVRNGFVAELRAALQRYKTIRLADEPTPDIDYRLLVSVKPAGESGFRLIVEAVDTASSAVFMSRGFDVPVGASADIGLLRTPARQAASFASPAGGALSRHLMASALYKPVEQLSQAECYAHAYDCTSCAGEVETLSDRTKACLQRLLEQDPDDPAAWALKASLHAHQYRWGAALDEPERTDAQARIYLRTQAIDAATRAEVLSDGRLPVVYWGMAQAYHASCDIDRMRTAIDRGLALNPDDPAMLAVFGSLIAFSGAWDEGVAMVSRAIDLDPDHTRPWWYFAHAKRDIAKGDIASGMTKLHKAYEERNWASHMSYAYTLAHLGRLDEARQEARRLMRLRPGITIEKVLQFYERSCFDQSWLKLVRDGLRMAGLPSRGESERLDRIRPVTARLMPVNGTQLEYVDVGQGEPVVFVPGGISDYRAWSYFEVPMSERHRYIAYTQRYFGTRPWPADLGQPTLQMYADDLIAFIEGLDAGPVHLVTWSFSGRVGMAAMAQRPDLFKSAVHYEPSARNLLSKEEQASPGMKAFSARFAPVNERAKAGDWQGAVEFMIDAVFEREPGGFFNETSDLRRASYDNARTIRFGAVPSDLLSCEYVGMIRTPTLIVNGGDSGFFFRRIAERSAQCIPGARLVQLPGIKHDGPVRRVDELVAMITEHVDRYQTGDQTSRTN